MATLSGQTTVTTAGAAVQLGSQLVNAPLMVKALPTNTGVMYVGNVGAGVSSANGLPLSAGEVVIFPWVGNLTSLWVDSSVDGEKVAWLVLDV